MSKEDYIPQFLDEPERYIMLTADELVAFVLPVGMLSIATNFLVGLITGVVAVFGLRKFKEGGPLYRILWRAHWIFPYGLKKTKATPPGSLRILAG